ncbi:DEAD/DEAH box helicase [Nocardia sp. NBC_01377]
MTSSPPAASASAVTFADLGLPAVLVQALHRSGIEAPFPIQAATVPDALAGKDVLGRGPTGSGKTLAFGLPMLTTLAGGSSAPRRPRGLVLVPTRELAAQIEKALDEPALALGLRVASVVGGAPIKRQADRLARGVDLLIATPGRLEDLIAQRCADLSDVRITALDEADHMADMGFLPQVTKLLDRTPKDGQRLLFSATLDGEVDKLVKRYLRSPVTHSTAPASASVSTMSHHLLYVRDKFDKRAVVAEIAAREGLTIMFVRTKHGADRLAKQLRGVGIATGALHGGKAQNNRTRTLAAFADGSTPVLVTTDVAARGIHVDGISLVVHVDPPAESKAYLHRAGRTARAGEDGVVVTLVSAEERAEVEKMTRKAGVDIVGVDVRPGDRTLAQITGARTPSGIALVAPAPPQQPARQGATTKRRSSGTGRRGGSAGADIDDPSGGWSPEGTPDASGRGGRRPSSGRSGARGAGAASRRGGDGSARTGGRDSGSAQRSTGHADARATRSNGVRGEGAAPSSSRAAATATAGRGSGAASGHTAGAAHTARPTRSDTPGQGRRRAGRPQGSAAQGNRRAN